MLTRHGSPWPDMNYFLWQNRRDPGDAMVYGGWPNVLGISMITGAPVVAPEMPIRVTLDASSQGRLTDSVLMTGPGRVFSARLVGLLQAHGVCNLEVFPCEIFNAVTGATHTDFHAVNVTGAISCVNLSRSEVDGFDDGSGRLLAWDFLTLDESRTGDIKLFPLAEMPVQLVVHRDLKVAIEAAGISGVEFVPHGKHSFQPFSPRSEQ